MMAAPPPASRRRQTRENRLEQGHTLGRIVGNRSGLERLLDAFAQRGRWKLGHDGRQRARGSDKRQVQSRKARRNAQIANRVVEKRGELGDVGRPVPMVSRRPGAEHAACIGRERQTTRRVLRRRHVVEDARDLGAQGVEVDLALRRRVVACSRRFRILIGALPIDRRLRNADEVQRGRRLVQPADRNRKHDAVGDASEVAVAHERRTVPKKDAVQQRVGGGRRRRTGGDTDCQSHGEQDGRSGRRWTPDSHGTISQQH